MFDEALWLQRLDEVVRSEDSFGAADVTSVDLETLISLDAPHPPGFVAAMGVHVPIPSLERLQRADPALWKPVVREMAPQLFTERLLANADCWAVSREVPASYDPATLITDVVDDFGDRLVLVPPSMMQAVRDDWGRWGGHYNRGLFQAPEIDEATQRHLIGIDRSGIRLKISVAWEARPVDGFPAAGAIAFLVSLAITGHAIHVVQPREIDENT